MASLLDLTNKIKGFFSGIPKTLPPQQYAQNNFVSPLQNPVIQQFGRDISQGIPAAFRVSPPGQLFQQAQGALQPQQQPQIRQQQLGDIYKALKPVGYIGAPGYALAGGALNVGIQGIANKLKGEMFLPPNADTSFAQGMSQAAALGPVSALNPFVAKAGMLPKFGQRIAGRAGAEGVEGAIQGIIEPLQSGESRVEKIAQNTGFAALMGGMIGTGGEITKIPSKVITGFAKKVGVSEDIMKRFMRDEVGRFATQQYIPKKEPVFYGDIREKLGLPRNGDYIPSPGLTTRAIGRSKAKPQVIQVPTTAEISKGIPPVSAQSPALSIDPVQKVIDALTKAKPLEQKQVQIYSKIRSQQAGAIAGIGQNIPGEKGFFQQLSQLKGAMPKVSFESIRSQLDQPTIDSLFNKVEQANITPFEKITAKSGLSKLLGAEGGSVPVKSELNLLNGIFPPEFIKAIQDKRPFMEKVFANVTDALNIPRAIMATADMSAPLRQGAFLIGRPKEWIPAFGNMFKYAFSPKAYQGLAEEIAKRPTYQLMRENRLAITDMGAVLGNREETFMSTLIDKIPGIGTITKTSNRAYSGFLNKLRADTFDSLIAGAKQQGLDIKTIAPDVAKFVNSATGRGDLGMFNRAAPVLNGIMFSPRLLASRLNLMNPKFYADLNPYIRKEALKSLFTFGSTALSILTLAKLNGAEVGIDPRNADFGKIKLGNTRYDILAGFQQPIRLASQLITGKLISSTTGKEFTLGEGYNPITRKDILLRFFESKESPILSLATSLMQGTNGIGQPFDLAPELVSRFIPMVIQDMYDLAKEKGSVLGALPSIFGVGVQTYGSQIPSIKITPTGKQNIKLSPVGGLAEDIVAKMRGEQPSNIPQSQWGDIVQSEQDKKQNIILKDKIKKQAEQGIMSPLGTFIPVVVDGQTKVIDTSFQPTPPQLKGLTELDKKSVSKFNSEVTKKANDIYDLYKAGNLTEKEADAQLTALSKLKETYAKPKAPKKISRKKFTSKKMRISMPKASKIQNIKIAKLSTPKLGKQNKRRIASFKIKPIRSVKLKGLTGMRAFV